MFRSVESVSLFPDFALLAAAFRSLKHVPQNVLTISSDSAKQRSLWAVMKSCDLNPNPAQKRNRKWTSRLGLAASFKQWLVVGKLLRDTCTDRQSKQKNKQNFLMIANLNQLLIGFCLACTVSITTQTCQFLSSGVSDSSTTTRSPHQTERIKKTVGFWAKYNLSSISGKPNRLSRRFT